MSIPFTNLVDSNPSPSPSVWVNTDSSKKRGAPNEIERFATKKRKMQRPHDAFLGFGNIILFLGESSFRDLVSFENASKSYRKLTQYAWRNLRKINRFQFDWEVCENEGQKDKWNYCLSQSLFLFLAEFRNSSSSSASAKAQSPFSPLFNRFEYLGNKFPAYGSLIYSFISRIPDSKLTPLNSELLKNYRATILNSGQKGFGGDSLYSGLFELYDVTALKPFEVSLTSYIRISTCMTRAIQQGATCASLAVVDYFPFLNFQLKKALAIESMTKGDSRALEKIVDKFDLSSFKEYVNCQYPPILLALARSHSKNKEFLKPIVFSTDFF